MLRNRVLFVLALAGLIASFALPFLTHAPNRLVSGQPISLADAIGGARLVALLPGAILLAGPFLPRRGMIDAMLAVASAIFLLTILWLAGAEAAALSEGAPRAARTSLGGAFWVLSFCVALAMIDSLKRAGLSPGLGLTAGAALAGAIGFLIAGGGLDQLSILQEYARRPSVFVAAVIRHVVIVIVALMPTLIIGVPLGVLAHRRTRIRATLFPLLNIVQTIPSIALFGLLLAPLSALASAFPALAATGISGIGVAPAVIALVLYSLLPIVRNTAEGLSRVSPAAIEAAHGIGMTPREVFWRVEAPLALPVFLSGLRIATVQAIGLTAVAALIGAGGLGAIMFQGLFANAQDLVLLGALPVIALALAADGLLKFTSLLTAERSS